MDTQAIESPGPMQICKRLPEDEHMMPKTESR